MTLHLKALCLGTLENRVILSVSIHQSVLAVSSNEETAREKAAEGGGPEREAHTTAQPSSSEEMN